MQQTPCLIVGAGPTGLALAAQLQWLRMPFRIIDRSLDRAGQSRALAVQARTLEVLDATRVADQMVSRGNTSARLAIHFGARVVATASLGDFAGAETRYPFILFISQAETERLLVAHLTASGATIERGVELTAFETVGERVECRLRHHDGTEERVAADYLVGCDGAHSTVREAGGFSFDGGRYPENFVLGDVEADGPLQPGAINSFAGGGGVAMFFPLGSPATWRVIGMKARDERRGGTVCDSARDGSVAGRLTLDGLQVVVDVATEHSVLLRDPAWLSDFRLHHRQTDRYRCGRVFLAGDAAHIHSPVGAQGMNTGIQDAWNLGWKLALVSRGWADARLLDTYDAERWPVGRMLLRYTDRIFSLFTRAMAAGRIARWVRRIVVPRVLPRLLASSTLRSAAFDWVSQLRIRYRHSPAVTDAGPLLRGGVRAGDRLPDADVQRDGSTMSLQRALVGPHLSLVLCGNRDAWDDASVALLAERYRGLVRMHHLAARARPDVFHDAGGGALDALGVCGEAQFLVRPDGYIAFRRGDTDLRDLVRYLSEWFSETR
jgi:2-polyprenyl-6-methoxyphenol hydroxylase-like FAD-dependent oxidoreductase